MIKKISLLTLLFSVCINKTTAFDGEKVWDIQARICATLPIIDFKTDDLSSTIDAIENVILGLSQVEETLCSKLAELETCIQITQEDIGITGFIISTPGKYCLVENVTHQSFASPAIRITADNVTLDLLGNTINCNSIGNLGILISGATNVNVKNGSIIEAASDNMQIVSESSCILLENLKLLTATSNGLAIDLSSEITIINCLASTNGADGFTLEDSDNVCFITCCASANTSDGFSIIDNASASNNTTYLDCKSTENTGNGFSAVAVLAININNTTICRCIAVDNGSNGFIVAPSKDTTLQSNKALGNVGIGFSVPANTETFNNLAKGNGTNYSGLTDPIESVVDTATGFWANVDV